MKAISDQDQGAVQLDLNFDRGSELEGSTGFVPEVEAKRTGLALVHSVEFKSASENTSSLTSHQVTDWIKRQALRLGW
ncbi:hypothetical protein D3C71_2154430 [compost metagenome]